MAKRERRELPDKEKRDKVPDRTKRVNRQQWAFLEALAEDPRCNQTQAAIKAGYSPKTAASIASQLLTLPQYVHVQEAWRELQKKRLAALEATAEKTILHLAAIAYGDRRKVAKWNKDRVEVVDSEELWPEEAAMVASIKSTDTAYGRTVSVKCESKTEALRLLAKIQGILKDRVVIEDYTEAHEEISALLEDLAGMVGEQDEILDLARTQLHQHAKKTAPRKPTDGPPPAGP